jgi:DNA repair protein RadB
LQFKYLLWKLVGKRRSSKLPEHGTSRPQTLVSTGIGDVDDMLGGGFEPGLFSLVYGDTHASVTSLLLSASVTSQLPSFSNGAGSKVVFIDAWNSFNPYTVSCKAASLGLNPETVLEGILVSRAFTSGQVEQLILKKAEEEIDRIGARVLIVSGLTALHLDDDLGKKLKQETLSHLVEIYGQLHRLSFQRNLVVLASTGVAENSEYRPAGGRALSHYANVHLMVRERPKVTEYVLMKHPSISERKTLVWKEKRGHYTPTLDAYFFNYHGGGTVNTIVAGT